MMSLHIPNASTCHMNSCDAAVAAAWAGLTSLIMGEYDVIGADDVLPPNLLELDVGNAAAAASLLPLTRLQQLSLQTIEDEVMPAAELRQLSAMPSLTGVDLTYWGSAQQIDAAADGWCALPLQYLYLDSGSGSSLQRNMLMQLSKLTRLSSLGLVDCISNSSIRPEMLGDVLAQLTRLHTLTFSRNLQQQEQEGQQLQAAAAAADAAVDAAADAAAGSFLERMLRRLSRSFHRMQLSTLNLSWQSIGRAEAAAIAEMEGLWKLELSGCDLEDCSVADIAFALHETLDELSIADNPRVTDASLPVLARLMPGIKMHHLRDTGVTDEGMQRYLPAIKQ
jgi:hypothetical protein